MKTIKYIILTALYTVIVMPLIAQQPPKNHANILSGNLEHIGDSMYVNMVIDLTNSSLDRNRSLTVTPILSGNNQQKVLPEILINGTTRHKIYQRSLALGSEPNSNLYSVIKLDKSSKRQYRYTEVLPYERWMDSSSLDVTEDLCGCGGHQEETATNNVAYYKYIAPTPFVPQLAYIQPEVEKTKARKDSWESYLDFPVNKTNILADYMNNPAELSKVESALKTIHSDKNITVKNIEIIGFASPEGAVAHNERLSEGRAESFKSYLQSKMNFPSNLYIVKYGGENWQGLEDTLNSSSISGKDQVLDIIKNTPDVNTRKNKIKALNNGTTYRQMLTDIYPKLRKVISNVQYEVRGFSVDEAKAIMQTRPQQLSLEEMFRISNTYTPGNNEFIEVFETAVRMFPNDKTANLNAAAAALSANDITKAKGYLDKADKNSPEYLNNIGVLYYMQNNIDQAKTSFEKAAQKGSDIARQNMEGLKK